MAANTPSAQVVHLISRVLGARVTPPTELNAVIGAVADAIRLIQAPKPVLHTAPGAAFVPIMAEPPAPVLQAEPVRRRGRPRKIVLAPPVIDEPEPIEEVVQAKLVRRADWIAHELEIHHQPVSEIPTVLAATDAELRGVVKWFDIRGGKGALRLTGIAADINFDASVLARSGLKRLYKDQEIIATVEGPPARLTVRTLALPGRPVLPAADEGDAAGAARRPPRPVMIEVKRDGSRRQAARAEAEQVFGKFGQHNPSRRLTQ